MSILSALPDGCGYYYARRPGDHRQINVRREFRKPYGTRGFQRWYAYVGGELIGSGHETKDQAEAAAIAWAEANPPTE